MPPVTVKASSLRINARVEGGKLLIDSESGYTTPDSAGVDIDDSTPLPPGGDEVKNLQNVLHIGTDYGPIGPRGTPAGPVPNSTVLLGQAVGDGDDLLEHLSFVVYDPARAAVYLEDGSVPDVLGGVTGTLPTAAGSSIALTLPFGLTEAVTANQLWNHVLYAEYIPEINGVSAGVPVKFVKRIVTNTAQAVNGTALSFTVSGELPKGASGATIVSWGIRPADAAWEICPPVVSGNSHAPRTLHWRAKNFGGFRLSVDSGVMAMPSGDY